MKNIKNINYMGKLRLTLVDCNPGYRSQRERLLFYSKTDGIKYPMLIEHFMRSIRRGDIVLGTNSDELVLEGHFWKYRRTFLEPGDPPEDI